MSKERRTVTLEQDVDNYLARDGCNASELVNKLVKQHMNCGAGENQIVEFRLQQVRSEYDTARSKAERKKDEMEELERRKRELQQQSKEEHKQTLEEVVEGTPVTTLRSVDEPIIDVPDETLERHAEELGMDVEELKDHIITESIDD